MNPEDVIKFEKMMASARDTWGANYQALLRVARAADAMIEKDAIYLGEASDLVEKLVEALKEVEDLLK